MNISTLTGRSKQEKTRQDVGDSSRPLRTSGGEGGMVTKHREEKRRGREEQKPSRTSVQHVDRLNGYTILQETPIISRLIVRQDGNHPGATDESPDDIPKVPATTTTSSDTNTSDSATPATTTLYKCHLCRCVCPTLHRMRCHLVFHCKRDSLQCFSFQVRSDERDSELEVSEARQDREALSEEGGERQAERLSDGHRVERTSRPGRESDPRNGSSSPVGRRDGGEEAPDGSREISRSERTRVTPGMDSCNSAAPLDSSSRKRSFSIDDDYRSGSSISARHINDVDGGSGRKKFSPGQVCAVARDCERRPERSPCVNGSLNLGGDSSFKSFDRDCRADREIPPRSPPAETDPGAPCSTDGLLPPFGSYDALAERCLLQQSGTPFFSPYYWLARQHWFGLGAYPEVPHQHFEGNRTTNSVLEAARKSPLLAVEGMPTTLPTSPPCSSPVASPPTSPPSKSSSPSVDSSSSSPLVPAAFHLYNSLELVRIMRSLTAYPNFLPPAYPSFFSASQSLQHSLQPDASYRAPEGHLSEGDETAVNSVGHRSAVSLPQPQAVASSLSLDKGSLPNYYPLVNFSPPGAYGLPGSKFNPAQNAAAAASSSPLCLTAYGQSHFYKSAFQRSPQDKSWPSPCMVKSPPETGARRDSKSLSIFCKPDKSEVMKSSAKRGEACRPIKLVDGRTVYHCSQCKKTFTNISDVNRHMDFHEDIRPFKCKFCSYYARTNSQLKVHMMRHQGIRQYVCHLCNYKGVTQSDLNRHTKSQIHVLKSRNECTHCSEGFVSPMNLAQHCKDRHRSSGT